MDKCPVCGRVDYLSEAGICLNCEAEFHVRQEFKGEEVEMIEAIEEAVKEIEESKGQDVTEGLEEGPDEEHVEAVVSKLIEGEEAEQSARKKSKKGICRKCGRQMVIKAHGLCGRCWYRTHRAEGRADVVISFEDYPDLLKKVRELAKQEFRTLEMEILYLVKQALEGRK